MADPTDVVGVLRVHLEECAEALEWAYGYFAAMDIADGYRQGRTGSRQSRTAAKMERSLEFLQAYLGHEEPSDGDGN